jgi:hypothetical protein
LKIFYDRIHVTSQTSYIKARRIRINTTDAHHIEEVIRLSENGIASSIASHARIPEGYQIFPHLHADGEWICKQIRDALSRLPGGYVIIERINC